MAGEKLPDSNSLAVYASVGIGSLHGHRLPAQSAGYAATVSRLEFSFKTGLTWLSATYPVINGASGPGESHSDDRCVPVPELFPLPWVIEQYDIDTQALCAAHVLRAYLIACDRRYALIAERRSKRDSRAYLIICLEGDRYVSSLVKRSAANQLGC